MRPVPVLVLLFLAPALLGGCAETRSAVAGLRGAVDADLLDGRGADDAGPLLSLLPARGFATGVTPAGADYIALYRGRRMTTGTDWSIARCGVEPAHGVCVPVTLRNMFAGRRVTRAFVEFTRLAPTAPTTRVAFRSRAPGDRPLGTSDAIGLVDYPPLGPAGAADDRAVRYWVFETGDAPQSQFRFSVVVKAMLE